LVVKSVVKEGGGGGGGEVGGEGGGGEGGREGQQQQQKSKYVPRVKMRSSQQLSRSTVVRHVSPVLSAMVADVPVVRMLSGRAGEGTCRGGCSMVGAVYSDM
jgi:hypothetical protein